MAAGTHLRHLEESIKKLEEISSAEGERLDSIQTTIVENQLVISELVLRLKAIDRKLEKALLLTSPPALDLRSMTLPGSSGVRPLATTTSRIQTRTIPLDFPRFDGTDPSGWISNAEHFFDYHHATTDQRLMISSLHMDGEALQWYQWICRHGEFSSWSELRKTLEIRFGLCTFEGQQGGMTSSVLRLQKLRTSTPLNIVEDDHESDGVSSLSLSPHLKVDSPPSCGSDSTDLVFKGICKEDVRVQTEEDPPIWSSKDELQADLDVAPLPPVGIMSPILLPLSTVANASIVEADLSAPIPKPINFKQISVLEQLQVFLGSHVSIMELHSQRMRPAWVLADLQWDPGGEETTLFSGEEMILSGDIFMLSDHRRFQEHTKFDDGATVISQRFIFWKWFVWDPGKTSDSMVLCTIKRVQGVMRSRWKP